MKKDNKIYLRHIADAASLVSEYIAGMGKEKFFETSLVRDAVIRQIEIIGEATTHLDDDFRKVHSDIPWSAMVGMRNMLIHQYFGVDQDIVWETAFEIIPKIREQILAIFNEQGE